MGRIILLGRSIAFEVHFIIQILAVKVIFKQIILKTKHKNALEKPGLCSLHP